MRPTTAFCTAIIICLCASTVAASAGTGFRVLRAFQSRNFSANPFSGLIADAAGDLYGTASAGGNSGCVRYASAGCGTVYELTPPSVLGGSWTEIVLYKFPGGNGPWLPANGLTMDGAGNLYGTTTDGGPYDCTTKYCGTAFKLTRPSQPGGRWTPTILYRFSPDAGGLDPGSGLTLDDKGDLYGTTLYYGPSLNGTIYRLSPQADSRAWWTDLGLTTIVAGCSHPPTRPFELLDGSSEPLRSKFNAALGKVRVLMLVSPT
ncbi:MAG TPA: choice-of-anchor tandem repeat GloVer-containing protein [Candidatus Eremiobacteraceae bacterium]